MWTEVLFHLRGPATQHALVDLYTTVIFETSMEYTELQLPATLHRSVET